jgi:hypothetical protein
MRSIRVVGSRLRVESVFRNWRKELALLAFVAGAALVPVRAHAQAADLPEACLSGLQQGTLPIDVDVPNQSGDFVMDLRNFSDLPGSGSTCLGYTWVRYTDFVHNPRLLIPLEARNVNVDADCAHSTINWALYRESFGQWTVASSGVMYGRLVNGTCVHDPANFAVSSGSRYGTTGVVDTETTYRLAVRHWQHDDTQIGHSGTWCNGFPECHLPTKLLVSSSPTMSGVFANQDWNTPAEWQENFTKGTCTPGWIQSGLSNEPPSNKWGHAVQCRYVGMSFLSGGQAQFVAGNKRAILNTPGDQRRALRTVAGKSDWAEGKWKLECGNNEYVAGSDAEYGDTRRFHGVMCAAAWSLNNANCNVRVFNAHDDRGASDTLDWDQGNYKGECGSQEYLAGVSVDPATYRPFSLLCCPR